MTDYYDVELSMDDIHILKTALFMFIFGTPDLGHDEEQRACRVYNHLTDIQFGRGKK